MLTQRTACPSPRSLGGCHQSLEDLPHLIHFIVGQVGNKRATRAPEDRRQRRQQWPISLLSAPRSKDSRLMRSRQFP
jgi:hypothetical protein